MFAQVAQAFRTQRLKSGFGKILLRNLMAIERLITQRRQRLLLLRRALQALRRGRLALFGNDPLPQRRVLRRLALAQQHRQRVAQHLAHGRMVVARRPVEQPP